MESQMLIDDESEVRLCEQALLDENTLRGENKNLPVNNIFCRLIRAEQW